MADRGDRGEGFASKAKRPHSKQVVRILQLAGGMARNGQIQFFRRDATTVIRHPHQLDPPLLQRDIDPSGARIDRILQQFLHDAGRTLNDFPCGDLVDDLRRQFADMRHSRVCGNENTNRTLNGCRVRQLRRFLAS